LALKSGGTLGGDFEFSKDRETAARFNAFYDFAFPRVYRYAQRRMQDESQAQALCRCVFIRAMASFGGIESGLDAIEDRMRHDEVGFAFWLFCLARRSADDLNVQLAENPERFADSDLADLELGFDDQSIEMLRGARSTSKT
jgi:DNA-directed RNA polymerase specialized sigma24 family protein